ncbi:MAG: hypothetical protein ACQEUM_07030 [Pseudomonadota bacterium]
MIYAVNKRTKEHRLLGTASDHASVDNDMEWRVVEADADGWIRLSCHEECPINKGVDIEWKGEDGGVRGPVEGADVSWDGPMRIVAYRPILDTNPCRFHDDDAEACETYSGQVPCEPDPVEWRGPKYGSPPIGTPVKVRTKECDSAAMVLANDHNIVVVRYESGMGFKYGGFDLNDVRPIRSEEDRAVEELQKAIVDYSNNALFDDEPLMLAEALYRAGYRKTGVAHDS